MNIDINKLGLYVTLLNQVLPEDKKIKIGRPAKVIHQILKNLDTLVELLKEDTEEPTAEPVVTPVKKSKKTKQVTSDS